MRTLQVIAAAGWSNVSLAAMARANYGFWCAQSRCRCGSGEPSLDADVGGVSPASPGADVGGASVRRRCGSGATPRRGRAQPRLQAFQRETWR